MCSYKLVSVKFEVWGLQTRVEQFVHKVRGAQGGAGGHWEDGDRVLTRMVLQVIRDILLIGHRQAFAWVDEWCGESVGSPQHSGEGGTRCPGREGLQVRLLMPLTPPQLLLVLCLRLHCLQSLPCLCCLPCLRFQLTPACSPARCTLPCTPRGGWAEESRHPACAACTPVLAGTRHVQAQGREPRVW